MARPTPRPDTGLGPHGAPPLPGPRLALAAILALLLAGVARGTDWDGSASTDWFNAANWSAGVPTATTDAVINSGLPRYPVLNASGAVCKNIQVKTGASLDLSTYTLEVREKFEPESSGVLSSSASGRLRFAGSATSEIPNALSFAGDIECAKTGAGTLLKIKATLSCNDIIVTTGTLDMSDGNVLTQTISGSVTIASGSTFDRNNATLDIGGSVSITGTYDDSDGTGSTSVAGNWTDSGTFTIGTRTVTFDGGGTSTITVPDSSDFYGITITNSTTARVTGAIDINGTLTINSGSTFDVDGDLDVTGGAVTCSGTGRLQIGSTVTSLGTFTAGSGTVEYDGTAANQTISTVTYYNLEIDKGSFTGTAGSTFTVTNLLTITSGTMDITSAGDVTVTGAVSVTGTLSMTGAGDLRLGTSVTVNSGGTFLTSGSSSPIVTNDGGGDYTFTIASGGTVNIQGLDIRNLESTGLTISDGATISNLRNIDFASIDPDNDGSNDTFLRIQEDAAVELTVVACSFDSSCTYNVSTAAGTGINVRMVVPSGARGTETYESEGTAGSIDWPAFTRTWVGGASGAVNDWDVAANWSPTTVPTSTDDCLIPNVTYDPILNTTGHVRAIYIDTGGVLTINSTQTMEFEGDLIIHDAGTFTMTAGTLSFTGTEGQSIDDEGGSSVTVYHLTVNKTTGTFSPTVGLTIAGNLTVSDGTFGASTHTIAITGSTDIDDTLTVSTGTVDANGSFDATGGAVTFTGSGRLQLGGNPVSLGTFTANASTVEYDDTGTSRTVLAVSYHNLEIDVGSRTATLAGNTTLGGALTVTAGTLAVGTATLTITGDSDVNGTVTLSSGTIDANGAFDGTGGAVTFTGAGRLQLCGAVTALGTLTPSTGTVEFDSTVISQTVPASTYYKLEIDKGSATATVSGALTVTETLTITGGTLDVNGTFDATGADLFLNAGRLQLGGAVTSIGTLDAGTGTVEFDDTSANRTIPAATYYDLEIDVSTRVALTGGDITVEDDLVVTSGELEVDDGDLLTVDDDVMVAGTLDLEPGSTLALAAATSLTVSGAFQAIGGTSDLALVTSSDTSTPGRYSFAVLAGGTITANHALFQYMNASGIQITDNASVQAIAQFDDVVLARGASGGTLLSVTNNDNAVTLVGVLFENDGSGISTNVDTTGSTAAITINPYGGDFGGPAYEDDNGGGTVTPGMIVWGAYSPARLVDFAAIVRPGGVLLSWETAAEWLTAGFALERAAPAGPFSPVGPSLIPATGVAPGGDRYAFLDDTPGAGPGVRYRLIECDASGRATELARAAALPPPGHLHAAALRRIALAAPRLSQLAARPVVRRTAGAGRAATPIAHAAAATAAAVTGPSPAPVETVRIRVEPDRVIRVRHDELAAAGFPVAARPELLRLRRGNEPWPLAVIDGGDGSFDPGDAIDFVAAPFAHAETRLDAYFLDLAPAGDPPPRIPSPGPPHFASAALSTSSPATVEVAGQDLYVLALAEGDGRDHFFDELLVSPGDLDVDVTLDAVAPGAEPVRLEVLLEGWSDDPLSPLDHFVRVLWDGFEVGELARDGAGPLAGCFEVPAPLAGTGSHTVTLAAEDTGLPGILYLDALRVRWRRPNHAVADRLRAEAPAGTIARLDGFTSPDVAVYRTSGAGAPERLDGIATQVGARWSIDVRTAAGGSIEAFTAAAAHPPREVLPASRGGTADPAGGADWVAIAPEAWHAELAPLAALRRSQGLRTAIVSLEEVHDRFGRGLPTADSVERAIAHARAAWRRPAPAYVLLVGDASWDPAGHLAPPARQALPARLIEVGGIQTASETRFAADGAFDLSIGRFPAATAAECAALVAKTIDHELAPGAPAAGEFCLVADDGAEFEGMAAGLAGLLPPAVGSNVLDLATSPLAAVRADLLGTSWTGASVVLYVGHGGRLRWADEGILHVADVPLLPADPRPPVVVSMSCWNGLFQHPISPSLGEALLLAPGRGAIAFYGPTAVTTTIGQQRLAEEVIVRIAPGSRGRLGDAIREARASLARDPAVADVLATWALLGDPALILR